MDHIYQNVTGWFSFPKFYSGIVAEFQQGSRFVEVGTYKGRSFSYLVVEAINSGKKFDIVGVDAFPWDDVEPGFLAHMAPLEGHYRYIKSASWDGAKHFEDGSISVAFIDADHVYEAVKKDILAYLPKMNKGGIIAGHDHNFQHPGVVQAVAEIFGSDFTYDPEEDVWQHRVK